jgi:uncharacterized protein involved in response to NO
MSESSLSHHVVRRGVASDISKGELTEQQYGLFLNQPMVCLFVVCVCVLGTVYVVFCCKMLQKNQKSTRQYTTLHHCNIIASLLRSSKIALLAAPQQFTALHCIASLIPFAANP